MTLRFKNASQEPRIFYGMHMEQGVCDYNDPKFKGRILVKDDALKRMNPSLSCKPFVVKHQDVTADNAEELADGWVVESFYNQLDGKHWSKFMVISDDGIDAIVKKGYKLSNCYHATEYGPSGKWHAVPYDKEVTNGVYEHLAGVPNPRYEASIVLTPEEFKAYNAEKEQELLKLANSTDVTPAAPKEKKSVLNLFRKAKVDKIENAADLDEFVVRLKSGTEKTLVQLVNEADAAEEKEKKNAEDKDKPVMANDAHRVKVGNDDMSVGDLVNKYNALVSPREATADEKMAADKKANEEKEKADKEAADKKANEEKEAADKEKDKHSNSFFDALDNAPGVSASAVALQNAATSASVYESDDVQVKRGQDRYGSKKPKTD